MEGAVEEDNLPESNVLSKAEANSATVHKTNLQPSTAAITASTVVNAGSAGQLIKTANGQTVVLTGPPSSTIVSPVINNSNHDSVQSTVAQALSVPGGMSIVQFQLSNPSNMVQSVIQPNHQSVIQATNSTSISALQLPKNVILLNKVGPGSVIQSTDSDSRIQLVKEENDAVNQAMYEDESKRRREILARRPSYRKILNELSSTEHGAVGSAVDSKNIDDDSNSPSQPTTILPGYLKVLPSIQIGSQDGSAIHGIPTIMTNTNSGSSGSTIVQYATSGSDGQFIVPADLQAYQIRPNNTSTISQNVVMTPVSSQIIDEASKKRELRLLKNREAAKECRRKKKEYIKCLENRVAVLENQNKALIDELKTLKELYCKKSD